MRKLGLITVLLLLTVTAAVAKPWAESKPYPAPNNTPSSRQNAASFSQSTIQGCVMGSAVTSQYVLTGENTGEIYVLQGNDALLKEQVGHEVVMTGTATPIRPSNQKGTLGYISPNSSPERGTSSQGARALNFQVNFIQPIANQCRQQTESQKEAIAASQAALGSVQSENQTATEPDMGYAAQSQTHNTFTGCLSGGADDLLLTQQGEHRTYRLQGNTAGLKTEIGMLARVTGRLEPGTGPSLSGATQPAPVVQVEQAQNLGEPCHYLAPPGYAPTPVTGGTGVEGEAENVSSTASEGVVTPGIETQAGRAQQAGRETGLTAGGVPQPQNQTAAQGAPPTAEQTAQNPAAAERMAAAARAELSNPEHQLGVNALPSYAQKRNRGARQH